MVAKVPLMVYKPASARSRALSSLEMCEGWGGWWQESPLAIGPDPYSREKMIVRPPGAGTLGLPSSSAHPHLSTLLT